MKSLKEILDNLRPVSPFDEARQSINAQMVDNAHSQIKALLSNEEEITEYISLTFIASGIKISGVRIRNLAKMILKSMEKKLS